MTDTYRYSSALRWLVGIVGVGVLLVLAVYFFPWNVLRPYVVSQLERATGRHVEINGDLEVKLGLRPRIVLNDLVLGNASWSETSVMAQAQQFSMVLSLPALFRYRIDLPEMTLTGAEVLLEQHPDHGGNWVLAGETSEEKSDWDLKIGQLQLQRTQVRYLEKSAGTDLVARVASTSVTETSSTPLVATLNGHYRKLSTNIDLNGGGLLSLRDRQLPYPLKAQGRMGNTAFNASGTVTDPMLLTGLAVDFVLSGDSMAELYTILNLPLPPTPRYRVAGKLMRTGSVWSLNSFTGSVGRSDLAGDFSVDKGPQRQYINADLQSRRLDLKDLAGFVGELDQKGDAAPQPPGKLLPHSPFHLEKLRAADMDVRFRGHQIITPKWPVDNMQANLSIEDGQLMLNPINFGVAGGSVVSLVRLDARKPMIATRADITLKQVHLQKLFPAFEIPKANVGLIGGQVELEGQGNSIAAMLADANGQIMLLMNEGAVSKLVLRLMNLDVANSLLVLLTGDKPVPIRCMVMDMGVRDGNGALQTLVLDTDKQLVVGEGNVNLRDEKIAVRLKARPKDISLAALRGPIVVEGTFASPKVRSALGQAISRVTLSALLGGIAGPLGLLPLLDLGGAKDSPCKTLASRAQSHSRHPSSSLSASALPSSPTKPDATLSEPKAEPKLVLKSRTARGD